MSSVREWEKKWALTDDQLLAVDLVSQECAEKPFPAHVENKPVQQASLLANADSIDDVRKFYAWHDQVSREEHEAQRSLQVALLEDLDSVRTLSVNAQQTASQCIHSLDSLVEYHDNLLNKVSSLHRACGNLVKRRSGLGQLTDLIDMNLTPFREAEACAQELGRPELGVFDDLFPVLLCRLDAGCKYMQNHRAFAQAEYYLSTFRHLQIQALTKIKTHLLTAASECAGQVMGDLEGKTTSTDSDEAVIELLCSRFHGIAPGLRLVVEEMEGRQHRKEVTELLTDTQRGYARIRHALIWPWLSRHIRSLFAVEGRAREGAKARAENSTAVRLARRGCACMEVVCQREQDLYVSVFGAGEEVVLEAMLGGLCLALTDVLRPLVIKEEAVSVLCEVLACLRAEGAVGGGAEGAAGAACLKMRQALVCDVQERLNYRVQLVLRDMVAGFVPSPKDLDYPNLLMNTTATSGRAGAGVGSGAEAVLYPPLGRVIELLSQLWQRVDVGFFEGVAQECLVATSQVLNIGSRLISKQSGAVHGQLFLIQHLLVLRERIGPFDVNFAFTERSLDTKAMTDYLSTILRQPRSLLNIKQLSQAVAGLIGEVRVLETQYNPKKNIEKKLKEACEAFIGQMAQQLAGELLDLLAQISAFVKSRREGGRRGELKDEPFAKLDYLKKVLGGVAVGITEKLPVLHDMMALYLDEVSTRKVLFRPVKTQIVEAYGSLMSFVQGEYLQEKWDDMGLPSTRAIAECLTPPGTTISSTTPSTSSTATPAPAPAVAPVPVPATAPVAATAPRTAATAAPTPAHQDNANAETAEETAGA